MKKAFIWMLLFCLLLVGCGVSSTTNTLKISGDVKFGEEDYLNIVSSNNELGFKLFAEAPKDDDGNIFISPTSLFMALAIAYNGADGETKEEIEKTLHAEGLNPNDLNRANASLRTILDKDSDQIQLSIANSVWLNDGYHFQEEFTLKNQDYYNAEIKEISIQDSQSPKMINEWVKLKTNNKIDKIVDEQLSENLVTILMNAIYFKGDWTYPFDTSLTKERTFTLKDGGTKEVPLMELRNDLYYMENDMFQAVSLPYGKEQEMSMKVFLPKEGLDLKEFEELLTFDKWKQWHGGFAEREGTVLLPKFMLEYEALLNEQLKSLGMPTAFTEKADFSKMIQEDANIYISEVKQKTFIDVDEEGTEAAAVTSVKMAETSMQVGNEPFYMEVNRPFFIVIVEESSGVILFMGSISNPNQ